MTNRVDPAQVDVQVDDAGVFGNVRPAPVDSWKPDFQDSQFGFDVPSPSGDVAMMMAVDASAGGVQDVSSGVQLVPAGMPTADAPYLGSSTMKNRSTAVKPLEIPDSPVMLDQTQDSFILSPRAVEEKGKQEALYRIRERRKFQGFAWVSYNWDKVAKAIMAVTVVYFCVMIVVMVVELDDRKKGCTSQADCAAKKAAAEQNGRRLLSLLS